MSGESDLEQCNCLHELLADPLIHLMMKADNVNAAHIEGLYRRVCASYAGIDEDLAPTKLVGEMAIYPTGDTDYRSGIGIMLLNSRNDIFVGQRIASSGAAWQMPQGGIEPGERPYDAAIRELREEIGTDNVAMLAESKGWLRYDLPPDLIGKAWSGRWRGQQQKWFGMRFRGTDAEINIATEHPEFSAWRWIPATNVADVIVTFKRQLYLDVLQEFRGFHTAECP